ncbi:carboxymuconolactone decarboxylase family protein [Actinomyces sp. MRS3W]|uniref:carboxymuconolactone decarboxylase family protein n=1 Tax=Actinomyces sp. MRS3W TaxID=2800796 RepID=UPI0028FD98A6|nr:carboxymuconolactone decarboxylase family protein [Actinomyces sp. MRS3W]MDU0348003.1 carboxymuconolactone decarboxylase family protein [Actinomyces sp. MRS3W]
MALTPQAHETLERLFGSPVPTNPTDPELFDILQNEIFGEVFSSGVLTDVERELLTVTALTAMQTLPQLAAHVGGALNVGATPLQVRETIYQCAPYIGFPKTLNAIATANQVFTDRGIELPLEEAGTVAYEDRERAGAAIQTPLYGDEVKQVFASLPEPFGELVPHLLTAGAFGDFSTRGVLDVAERELISLVAIAAIGAATQLRPHVAGAIKAGCSRQKVAAALVQVMPYIGGPYALTGLVLVANYDENASSEAYR